MAATGFTWFLGNFADVGVAAVAWVAAHAVYLHRGPLVQLVLTYPSGRPGSRLVRGAVAVGYAAAVITPIWRSEGATIVLAALLVVVRPRLCSGGRPDATGAPDRAAGRRRAEPGACGNRGGSAAAAAWRRQRPVAACVRGGAVRPCRRLLAGLLVAPWQRDAVADLVVELGEARSGTLRGQLSRALGDPSLEIGYWLPDRAVSSTPRAACSPSPRRFRAAR